MIKIYHNNRCGKSRSGLKILEASGKEFEIINYLEVIPDREELENIIHLLGIKPIDLVRKNEAIWKSDYKGKMLTDFQIIDTMLKFPKLIERPIVINNNKAIIARPPELIKDII